MPDQLEPPEGLNWEAIDEKEFYRFAYTLYFHQDKLSWSRTQILFAIEAAVLAVAFVQRVSVAVSVAALLVGSALAFLIWRLIQRDWQVRNQYDLYLKRFHARLITDPRMRDRTMVVPPKSNWYRGGYIVPLIVWSLIAFNVLCAIGFLWHRYCTHTKGATFTLE